MLLSIELKQSIIKSLVGKYALYIFQIVSLTILARVFAPEDFGIIAAAQVFIMFFQVIGTSGLAPAVVYESEVPANMRDGVFTFTWIVGAILAVIFAIFAPQIYQWFEFTSGLYVFYILAVCVFFSALTMMPLAALLKDSKFIAISQAEIFAEACAFGLCLASYYLVDFRQIALSFNTFDIVNNGLFALTIRFLCVPIFRFLAYWFMSSSTTIGRPAFGRDIKQVKKLYAYAKYQIMFNVLNFFSRNLDNLLLAKYFGASVLGVYEKTYQVMRYPLQLFTFAITPALQPVLTKYRDDPDLVYSEFFKIANRLAVVGVFTGSVLYWCAQDIVLILFGDQWLETVPLLRILALSIPVQMVLSSTGGVFQAFGKVKAMLLCGVFSSVCTVAAIVYGIHSSSLMILCYSLVGVFHINYIQCMFTLNKSIFPDQSFGNAFITTCLIGLIFINSIFSLPTAEFAQSILDAFIHLTVISAGLLPIGVGLLFGLHKRKM